LLEFKGSNAKALVVAQTSAPGGYSVGGRERAPTVKHLAMSPSNAGPSLS
jgi:hypothetical protein